MATKITKRTIAFLLLFHLFCAATRGALPLLVDDAGTVPPGEMEVFVFYEIEATSGEQLHAFPVEVTVGIHPRADFTLAGGYQIFDGDVDVDGWMDTEAAAKVAVWSRDQWALSVEGIVKFPTASERKGLGSGEVDGGFNVALTHAWDRTAVDLNAGYMFAGSSEPDEFPVGVALRREVAERLEIFAEALTEIAMESGEKTIVLTRAGAIWQVSESFHLAGGIGPAFGSGAPDLTGTVGAIATF